MFGSIGGPEIVMLGIGLSVVLGLIARSYVRRGNSGVGIGIASALVALGLILTLIFYPIWSHHHRLYVMEMLDEYDLMTMEHALLTVIGGIILLITGGGLFVWILARRRA